MSTREESFFFFRFSCQTIISVLNSKRVLINILFLFPAPLLCFLIQSGSTEGPASPTYWTCGFLCVHSNPHSALSSDPQNPHTWDIQRGGTQTLTFPVTKAHSFLLDPLPAQTAAQTACLSLPMLPRGRRAQMFSITTFISVNLTCKQGGEKETEEKKKKAGMSSLHGPAL